MKEINDLLDRTGLMDHQLKLVRDLHLSEQKVSVCFDTETDEAWRQITGASEG